MKLNFYKNPRYSFNILLTVALVFSGLFTNAQANLPPWGNFSAEEISMKECSFDKEAEAIILLDEGNSTYDEDSRLLTQRRIRVKILNKRGLDWANISIPFYSKDDFESVQKIEAITYNFEEGNISTSTQLDKKTIYKVKKDAYYSLMKFAMPTDVMVDEPDAVRLRVWRTAAVEIDAMLEVDGAGHPGAIIADAFAVGLDGGRSDQLGSRLHNGGSTRRRFNRLTAGRSDAGAVKGTFGGCGAANQRRESDDESDQHHSAHGDVSRMHEVKIPRQRITTWASDQAIRQFEKWTLRGLQFRRLRRTIARSESRWWPSVDRG